MRYCVLLACVAVGCGEAVPEETPDAAVARDAGRDAGAAVKDAGTPKTDAGRPQVDGGGVACDGGMLAVSLRWKVVSPGSCTSAPGVSDTLQTCDGFAYLSAARLDNQVGVYMAAGCTAAVDCGTDSVAIDCTATCASEELQCRGFGLTRWTCAAVPYTSSCTWSPP